MNDVSKVTPGSQPTPTLEIPKSLQSALDTFMVAATYKRVKEADQNCAFLCHVSTSKSDHQHIVNLLRKYKTDLAAGLKRKNTKTIDRLKLAYKDLSTTHSGIKAEKFSKLLESIEFLSPGIAVKLVNGDTDEDVVVRSPYNLFVGGNKLGRGVTIKNLLVSYYGRNPKKPQADTVLQHARMYGYRREDIGLLRLFLPKELHLVFKAIHKMETSLRKLIAENPNEEFRGVYISNGVKATRRNILAPGSIGMYTGGSNYNPSQVLRNNSVRTSTAKIDNLLELIANKDFAEIPISKIKILIELVKQDESKSEHVWNSRAISESLEQFAKIHGQSTGYVYVDRNRAVDADRRETAGILEGGEFRAVPNDKIAIYMLRIRPRGGNNATWWPQIRFPDGRYAFAFAI